MTIPVTIPANIMYTTTAPPATDADHIDAGRRTRICLLLAAACVSGFMTTYLVAVRTARGQALDQIAGHGRNIQPRSFSTAAEHLLSTISQGSIVMLTVLCLATAVARHRTHLALLVACFVGGAYTTTETLKLHVLTRPQLLPTVFWEMHNSLPSGHSSVSLCVVVALVLVVPRRWQGVAAVVGAPYAIGIGIAAAAVGGHRPSDVVASCFVVGAWLFALLAVAFRRGLFVADERARWERFVGPALVFVLIAVVAVLGVVTLFGLFANASFVSPLGRRGAFKSALAYGLSVSVTATLTMSVIATLLWLVRDVRFDR